MPKQGRVTNSGRGSQKVEPSAKAVDPGSVAGIGIKTGRATSKPLYQGRGYEAPKAGTTTHKSGSQGDH